MIECTDGGCRIRGDLTVDTVGAALRALRPHLERGITQLDLSAVESADSAALALIFKVRRAHSGVTLTGLPASFAPLAELYGVTDLLST